jgi:hypothetical protein
MGVSVSHQRKNKGSLFVDDELNTCRQLLTNNNLLTEDFARFIKDGSWIDLLEGSSHFTKQISTTEVKSLPVTFYSNAPVAFNHLSAKIQRQSSNSVRSLRSSSTSTRDSAHSAVENFTEFYANIEEQTCFTPLQMLTFLVAIVYPLYHEAGERKAICEREITPRRVDDYESMPEVSKTNEDVVHLQVRSLSHQFRKTVADHAYRCSRQEMLLSTAAFFDENDINNTLLSGEWLNVLNCAVNDCPLHVCICEIDTETGALHPVLINNASRKRIHSLNKSSSHQHKELDFLQLWSIENEEILKNELDKCFRGATPLRLYSLQSAEDCRTVLDVSYIFDADGTQRYVLGVQMTVPEQGQSAKHLQYLRDTALVICHIIKTETVMGPGITACQTTSSR